MIASCCGLFNFRNKVKVSIHSSWLNSILLSIVRIIALILMSVRFFLYANDSGKQNAYSLIYLTFYGFMAAWIYFIVIIVHLLIEKLLLRNSPNAAAFTGLCVNVVYEVAFALQFVLTLLYWTLLANGGTNLGTFDNVGFHGMPLLLLVADFAFNSHQFPIRHLSFTFVFGAIYIIINQVHSCSETAVYDVYECGNVWLPIVAFAILAVAHFIGHLTWKFWRANQIKKILKSEEGASLLENEGRQDI